MGDRMRTREEIEARLGEVLEDDRLHEPPASVQVDAGLALVQVALKAQVQILRWVLSEKE